MSNALLSYGNNNPTMNGGIGSPQAGTIFPQGIGDTFQSLRVINMWEIFFYTTVPAFLAQDIIFSSQPPIFPTVVSIQVNGSILVSDVVRSPSTQQYIPIQSTLAGPLDPNTWYHLVVKRLVSNTITLFNLGKRGIDIFGNSDTKHTYPYGVAGNGGQQTSVSVTVGGESSQSFLRTDGFTFPRPFVGIGARKLSTGGNDFSLPLRGGVCEMRAWHRDLSDAEIEGNATHFVHTNGGFGPGPVVTSVPSVGQPGVDLIHCWRLNEPAGTPSASDVIDYGSGSGAQGGQGSQSVFTNENPVDGLNSFGFPAHPFQTPTPTGFIIPVDGFVEVPPLVQTSRIRWVVPSVSRGSVQPFAQIPGFRHNQAEFLTATGTLFPSVVGAVGVTFAPPDADTGLIAPSVAAEFTLPLNIAKSPSVQLPPLVSLAFNWLQNIAPDENSLAPSTAVAGLRSISPAIGTSNLAPTVSSANVVLRPVAGESQLQPIAGLAASIDNQEFLPLIQLEPVVTLAHNHDQVESTNENILAPTVSLFHQLNAVFNLSPEVQFPPSTAVAKATLRPKALTSTPDFVPTIAATAIVKNFFKTPSTSMPVAVSAIVTIANQESANEILSFPVVSLTGSNMDHVESLIAVGTVGPKASISFGIGTNAASGFGALLLATNGSINAKPVTYYWPLGEASGTIATDIGSDGTAHGTRTGGAFAAPSCTSGTETSFAATSLGDRIVADATTTWDSEAFQIAPLDLDERAPWTAGAWFSVTSVTTDHFVFSKTGWLEVWVDLNGALHYRRFYGTGGSADIATPNGTITSGQNWFVAMTWSWPSGQVDLYLNGQLINSDGDGTPQNVNNVGNMTVGRQTPTVGSVFGGRIQHLFVYEEDLLTPAQILALYDAGRVASAPELTPFTTLDPTVSVDFRSLFPRAAQAATVQPTVTTTTTTDNPEVLPVQQVEPSNSVVFLWEASKSPPASIVNPSVAALGDVDKVFQRSVVAGLLQPFVGAGGAADSSVDVDRPVSGVVIVPPSATVLIEQAIDLSATIKEGTGLSGAPVNPEDVVAVVDIFNAALVRLGAACIDSTTDGSNNATKLNKIWPEFRTQFLSEHTWNGAKKTVLLAQFFNLDGTTVVTPPVRWSYTYVLPTDIIRAVTLGGMSNEPRSDVIWEIESRANDVGTQRVLHTNMAPDNTVELEYIWDVNTQVNLLAPKTRWAMVKMLAWFVAEGFGKSVEDMQQLETEARSALAAAKGIDGQEMTGLFFAETGLSAVRDRDRFGSGSGSRGFR